MQHIELPEDYSLVLQEICEHGAEEFDELAESLNLEQHRLQHIIQALQHKGLVIMNYTYGHGVWVRLSAKGRKFIQSLWPESGLSFGY